MGVSRQERLRIDDDHSIVWTRLKWRVLALPNIGAELTVVCGRGYSKENCERKAREAHTAIHERGGDA